MKIKLNSSRCLGRTSQLNDSSSSPRPIAFRLSAATYWLPLNSLFVVFFTIVIQLGLTKVESVCSDRRPNLCNLMCGVKWDNPIVPSEWDAKSIKRNVCNWMNGAGVAGVSIVCLNIMSHSMQVVLDVKSPLTQLLFNSSKKRGKRFVLRTTTNDFAKAMERTIDQNQQNFHGCDGVASDWWLNCELYSLHWRPLSARRHRSRKLFRRLRFRGAWWFRLHTKGPWAGSVQQSR